MCLGLCGCLVGYEPASGAQLSPSAGDGAGLPPVAQVDAGGVGDATTPQIPVSEPASVSADLVADFPFDGDLRDASGNGHDVLLTDDATFVGSPWGQALRFGEGGPHLPLSSLAPTFIASIGSLSMVARLRVNAYVDGQEQVLFSLGEQDIGGQQGLRLSFQEGELRILGALLVGFSDVIALGAAPPTGQWVQLVVVVDFPTASAYVDGQLLARTPIFGGAQLIGQQAQLGGLPGANNGLDGDIDRVRFYVGALTDDDVQALQAE